MIRFFKSIQENIKARITAKKFNVMTETIDQNRKSFRGDGEWIADSGVLYYGNPWLIFFKSHHNNWWDPELRCNNYSLTNQEKQK